MQLLLSTHRQQLITNGLATQAAQRRGQDEPDHHPVVKLFTPDGAATWLLTEIDPDNEDIAFGLCDLGMGFPELGSVSLHELVALRGRLGLPVERDEHFTADKPLSAYCADAHRAGKICA